MPSIADAVREALTYDDAAMRELARLYVKEEQSDDILADDLERMPEDFVKLSVPVEGMRARTITAQIHDLDEWLGRQVMTRKVWFAVLHHTETPQSWWNGASSINRIWDWHVNGRGWRHIGYHFVVGPDGTLWACRPINWTGAHAGASGNVGSFGISMWASLVREQPTPAAAATVGKLWSTLADHFGFPPTVRFHREYMSTDCPGKLTHDQVRGWIENAGGTIPVEEGDLGVYYGDNRVGDGALIDNVSWVPVRDVATAAGFQLKWQEEPWRGAIVFDTDRTLASVPTVIDAAGKAACYVMDRVVPAAILDGTMYAPARPFGAGIRKEVTWFPPDAVRFG